MSLSRTMPTIGIAGVTIPGAIDCINKINLLSRHYFKHHEHPNIILNQPNFSLIHAAQNLDRWDIVENILLESIDSLKIAGADFVIIPANTVHKVIKSIQSRSSIPVINMLDIVAHACKQLDFKKVGIMGTRWTMSDHLYNEPLNVKGIMEVIPSSQDQLIVQCAIIEELIPHGKAKAETISALLSVVDNLKLVGCDVIALACTELPLVLNKNNCSVRVLDTTEVLAEAAIKKVIEMR